VADEIFDNPKLALIYDHFDGSREDLVHYLNIAKELKVKSVLDIGCGTGSFASILSKNGFTVTGIDPAKASLDIAKGKPSCEQVNWIHGMTADLPKSQFDIAFMTGNVAQVFTSNEEWENTFHEVKNVLKPSGFLVFEVRDPSKKAWLNWNKEKTYSEQDIEGLGKVTEWCDLIEVSNELVSFRWNYIFSDTGETLTSDSTLRFRQKDDIVLSLERNEFTVKEIRDAPDRPSKEFVFIAQRN
jgi:SAM-dependent methyltransferase